MNDVVNQINIHLKEIIDRYPDGRVKEAMVYSLLAGGKRIRPLLLLQIIRSYGLDYKKYMDIACAVEMIHTYSLIHDDLPGMDNDDMRRGRPTCHKQFDEATAILAGDALLNEAVNVVLNTDLNDSLKVSLLKHLYTASGLKGMILGQELDLAYENKQADIDILQQIHDHKTGAMLSISMVLGALIASPKDADIWSEIGYKIGLAFQIQDDILDVVGDEEILGKPVGSDEANTKSTYVTLLGIEKSQEIVSNLYQEAMALLYQLMINHGLILEIIELLRERVS